MRNGYKEVYCPNHPNKGSNGCVPEHILCAENKIGRFLLKGECVHHIDRNKLNNNINNLMIFRTNSDHTRYHNTGLCECSPDGIYTSPEQHRTCSVCAKIMKWKSRTGMCKVCYEDSELCKNRYKVKIIPTEDMLKQFMLDGLTFTEMGKLLGITCNGVRKWCSKFQLPTNNVSKTLWIAENS